MVRPAKFACLVTAAWVVSCAIGDLSAVGQTLRPVVIPGVDTVWYAWPPPDSLRVPDVLIVKFQPEALALSHLCYEPVTQVEEDGLCQLSDSLMVALASQDLPIDSTVISNPAVVQTLILQGATHMKRLSFANPCTDTVTMTSKGDTIRADDYLWMTIHFTPASNIVAAQAVLETDELNFQLVTFSVLRTFCSDPTDDYWPSQKSLDLIGAPLARNYEIGDPETRVAVIDAGVDHRTCDLGDGSSAVVLGGFNWPGRSKNTHQDYDDHGTAMASIIAAKTDAGFCLGTTGGAGIAGGGQNQGGVKVIPYKASWTNTPSRQLETSYIIASLLDATARSPYACWGYGAAVINMSFGSLQYDPGEAAAVATAYQRGAVLHAARGNSGGTRLEFPACYDPKWLVVAGGGTSKRVRDEASSYGPGITDVIAPFGRQETPESERIVYTAIYNNQTDWMYRDGGTSAATAHASGSSALLWSTGANDVYLDWNHDDVQGILQAAAKDVTTDPLTGNSQWVGYDRYSGYGYLDVGEAYQIMDPYYGNEAVIHHLDRKTGLSFGEWSNWYSTWLYSVDGTRPTTSPGPFVRSGQHTVRRRPAFVSIELSGWDMDRPLYVWGRHNAVCGGAGHFQPYALLTTFTYVDNNEEPPEGLEGPYQHIVHGTDPVVECYIYQYEIQQGGSVVRYPTDENLGASISVLGWRDDGRVLGSQWPDFAGDMLAVQPNPTRENVVISVRLRASGSTTLSVVNSVGAVVREADSETDDRGFLQWECDVRDLPPGSYSCIVVGDGRVQRRALQVVR